MPARIPQLMVLAFGLVISAVALSQPPRRVQLSFDGITSASQLLIQDVVKNVMVLGEEQLGCATPDSIVAEVLPEGFQPAESESAPEGAGPPLYERWTVSFCGSKVPVLLTFGTMERGGTAFDVGYPFQESVAAVEELATRLQ